MCKSYGFLQTTTNIIVCGYSSANTPAALFGYSDGVGFSSKPQGTNFIQIDFTELFCKIQPVGNPLLKLQPASYSLYVSSTAGVLGTGVLSNFNIGSGFFSIASYLQAAKPFLAIQVVPNSITTNTLVVGLTIDCPTPTDCNWR